MEVLNKPELTHLNLGESFKTLQITGSAGMVMPTHHSTKEAVIVVQKGKALLQMPKTDHVLYAGSTFIIPAGVEHKLDLLEDFKAIAIMAVDSELNFK
ncbi:cupin domain-containing protein [Flavobacteriaceae bacterium F89]|uniref:Cupin domain-containing protein n=1 Tax=Cerina litoralis TaxID=2874477 RepID=A0AAE3EWS9_9FLAO|nr:cupin domain-containing protein [Cerina litoralis]MCG2462530.1 cupin domain-containing protein [Cerina litoralis]